MECVLDHESCLHILFYAPVEIISTTAKFERIHIRKQFIPLPSSLQFRIRWFRSENKVKQELWRLTLINQNYNPIRQSYHALTLSRSSVSVANVRAVFK